MSFDGRPPFLPRPRSGQAVPSVRHNQLTLELREYRQHPEHRPTFRGRCVDSLLEDLQLDPALAQLRPEGDQMQYRAPQSVEASDHQRVPTPQPRQNDIELRARRFRTAGMIEMNVLGPDARPRQRIDLMSGILISPRRAAMPKALR